MTGEAASGTDVAAPDSMATASPSILASMPGLTSGMQTSAKPGAAESPALPPTSAAAGLHAGLLGSSSQTTAASSAVIGSGVPPIGVGSMLQVTFALVVVLALVFLFGWIARRLGLQPSTRRGGLVKVVGSAALGARERVVVVEIRDTWLVLGVASGSVRRLHTLPATSPRDSAPGNASRMTDTEDDGPNGGPDGDDLYHAADDGSARPPSFQAAFARQLRDRLHGLGGRGKD